MTYLIPQSTWFGQQPAWFGSAAAAKANSRALSAVQREIDRCLDELGGWPSTASAGYPLPRVSVSATDDSVEIEAELPGVDEKDLEVTLNEDVLTIKGETRVERDEQQKDYYCQERTFGRFARSITLPFDPDPTTVRTLFAKGVLKITLPKSAGIKQNTVKIPVRAAA